MSRSEPSKDDFVAVEYMVQQGLEGIRRADPAARRVSLSDIARYVMGADVPAVEAKLQQDLTVRRQYQQLLKKQRRMYMPVANAAASTDLILERDSDLFSILVLPAKNHPGQYYVSLQLKPSADLEQNAELVMHVILEDKVARCNFPPLRSGRGQVVVSEQDLLFKLISSANSEVFVY